jgi:hypothetical protein
MTPRPSDLDFGAYARSMLNTFEISNDELVIHAAQREAFEAYLLHAQPSHFSTAHDTLWGSI